MNCHIGHCDGLERSQFALISSFPPNGLERSQMLPDVKGLEMSQCASVINSSKLSATARYEGS